MRNPDPANWGKWELIPHPELWQAVCLSMDFEPPKSCDVVEFLRLDQKTFKDRMQVCMANIGPHPELEVARVNLATFAAVVSKWGWPIPQQLQALEQHAPTPAPAKATLPDEARTFKPEPQPKPVLEQPPSGAPEQGQAKVVKHTTKGKRRDILTPVIEHAQSLCRNPLDTAQVWGVLHNLDKKHFPTFIHYEGKAIAYMEGDETKLLTLKKLADRLRGQRVKPPI